MNDLMECQFGTKVDTCSCILIISLTHTHTVQNTHTQEHTHIAKSYTAEGEVLASDERDHVNQDYYNK
jgi:hypothetical protein